MNSPQKSQQELAELLNLTPTSQPREEDSTTQSHLDLITANEFSQEPNENNQDTIPNSQKSMMQGINRLTFVAFGSGTVVLFLVGFFLLGMNIQSPVAVEEPTVEEKAKEIQITPKERQDQLYRAKIALAEQKDEIARIDELKANRIKIAPPEETKEKSVTEPKPAAPPAVRPVTRQPINRPRISTQVKPKETQEPKYDNLADWQKLANIGTYGASNNDETEVVRRRATPVVEQQIIPSNKVSPYVMGSRNRNFTALSPIARAKYDSEKELVAGESNLISTLNSIRSTKRIEAKLTRKAAANQKLKAKLLNPIQWADEADEGYSSFLNLEEDLIDASGEILIPQGSQLIYEIDSITNNGVIRGKLTTAITDGQEINIPNGAISLRNKKGGLLVAKYKNLNNGSGNRDLLRFTSGAIDGLSEVISRPDRTSSSSSSFTTSISTNYGDHNYIETALSKGAADILEGRVNEMEKASDNTPILGIWELKEDTKVTLIINRSFEIEG